MAQQNGILIITERDMNINSPTYNTTREREIYDPVACPDNAPNYINTDEYCEIANQDTGLFSGKKILVFTDMNPNSDSYLDTYEEYVDNASECTPQDTAPDFIEINRECELKIYQPSGVEGLTGNAIVTYIDDNEFSLTADEEKTEIVIDGATCPAPNTDPSWTILSSTCNLAYDENNSLVWDGTANVIRRDDNVYSNTYGTTETTTIVDTNACPTPLVSVYVGGSVLDPTTIEECDNDDWKNQLVYTRVKDGSEYDIMIDKNNINTKLIQIYPNEEYLFTVNGYSCDGNTYTERVGIYYNEQGYPLPATITFALKDNKIHLSN